MEDLQNNSLKKYVLLGILGFFLIFLIIKVFFFNEYTFL